MSVLAISVTFIFVGPDDEPTDLDGDHKLDIAANEIYFNDGFAWQIGSGYDVETVALHELGHSLGIGHVNPKHTAAMNPTYAGVRAQLTQNDRGVGDDCPSGSRRDRTIAGEECGC